MEPAAGQESVWNYPRPPRLEKVGERLRVMFNGKTIADTVAGPADSGGKFMVRIQGPREILVARCRG